MWSELKELWKFRELLRSGVERELKIRYKNSFLGFLWSLLNPLLTVLVMTLVFKKFLGFDTASYTAYIFAAYLPFIFFQSSVLDSSQSVLAGLPIVKKVYFPREIMPLSTILANFLHFLLALLIFFCYLFVVWILNPGVSPFQWTALYLPLLLVINLMLSTGLGLFVSALTVFYEDVRHILGVVMYLMLFLCPVMYFSENVYYSMGRGYYTLYHLNPVAALTDAYRHVLLAKPAEVVIKQGKVPALGMDWSSIWIAAVVSFFILWGGYAFFNRMKWRFVERP